MRHGVVQELKNDNFEMIKDSVHIEKLSLDVYSINYGIIRKEFYGTSDIYMLLLP
jgi:hypothetical protein